MKKSIIKSLLITAILAGIAVLFLSGCTQKEDELSTLYGDEAVTQDNPVVTKAATLTSMPGLQYVPNQVLVKFKTGTKTTILNNILSKVNGKIAEKILTHAMELKGDADGVILLSTPLSVLPAIEKLKKFVEIEYAEPNYIYTTEAISDPYYTNGSLWGMYGDLTSPSNQYGSHAGVAWITNTGSSDVYVGIIDEGYMYTHEDLAANAGKNPGEIAGDRKDNDKNGYVDDVYGWDFNGRNNSVFDGTEDDHGTHVAGTIGAVGNNGLGVAGMCWNVKLMDAKFLGRFGGTTANAVKAIDYFTNLKVKNKVNIVATNNSWGGGGYSQALYDAIERAKAADILFIAAAGNSSADIDASPSYPAAYTNDNIISVASITSTGDLSSFSNYGATAVDLGAPGSEIWSCIPKLNRWKVISSYANYSGTSMATPHVTGAAALYKAAHPNATAAEIKAAILLSTTPTPSLNSKCKTGGRLNVSTFIKL